MATLVLCTSMFNPLPGDLHCSLKNMTPCEEVPFSFTYAGRTFRALKPAHQCTDCAAEYAKYLFGCHIAMGILKKDKLTGAELVNWTYIRQLRRQKKGMRARAIPQSDDLYRAFQVLHDLAIFMINQEEGWEVRDLSGIGDGSHVSPSYYKFHKLYFVDLKEAIRYCKTCLAPRWGFYRFEVRKGDIVYTQEQILNTRRAPSSRSIALPGICL